MIKLTIEIPCNNKQRKEFEKEVSRCIPKGKSLSPSALRKLLKNKTIIPYTNNGTEILTIASKILK